MFEFKKEQLYMLYLDYCATTPIYDEVIDVITAAMKTHYGNPSSLHRIGMDAEQVVIQARKSISAMLQCHSNEIIFTSGGTESNNLAIKGTVYAHKNRGKHIITSAIEHSSVYECMAQLEQQGFRVTYIPADQTGAFQLDDVRNAIEEDTVLVSLMHVNNEMGRIQPIQAVGQWLRQYPKISFHVDAIQSIGKLEVFPQQLGADLLSISAHKFGGPKGIGLLYRRAGLELRPELIGGGQEFGIRSGTENVAFIAGMAKAMQITIDNRKQQAAAMYLLREKLIAQLSTIDSLIVNGTEVLEHMAPQLVHFCFPGMRAEIVIHALEQQGICISTRSACSSGLIQPSRVLLAMGMDPELARCGLRVSYSAQQTSKDIDFFIESLRKVVAELQIPKQAYAASKQNNRRR
jgi:cysteine desulfurase